MIEFISEFGRRIYISLLHPKTKLLLRFGLILIAWAILIKYLKTIGIYTKSDELLFKSILS